MGLVVCVRVRVRVCMRTRIQRLRWEKKNLGVFITSACSESAVPLGREGSGSQVPRRGSSLLFQGTGVRCGKSLGSGVGGPCLRPHLAPE